MVSQLQHLTLFSPTPDIVVYFEVPQKLPETVSQLQHLTLSKVLAAKLTSIPDGIGRLSRLCELDLSDCNALQKLQSSLTQLRFLCVLRLNNTSIVSLPPRFALLTRLRTLNLFGCDRLKALPGDLTELKVLQELNVRWCKQAIDGMSRALRCGLRDMHGLTFVRS
ncbi:unnamed protein product [Closterium sp. NIES-54]